MIVNFYYALTVKGNYQPNFCRLLSLADSLY